MNKCRWIFIAYSYNSLRFADLTRRVLLASMQVIRKQAEKLDEYEAAMKTFSSNEMKSFERRMEVSENMIRNLAHNIQGYVDPEDDPGLSPTQTKRRQTLSSLENSDKPTFSTVPTNFLEK